MNDSRDSIIVRTTQPDDFPGIIDLTQKVYPESIPWSVEQLSSHLQIFPEGQFVAIDTSTGNVVGMAASLIVLWDDYDFESNWREFTDNGMFTNHDPKNGRTLYGAEVMVNPFLQGKGIGSKLYAARRELTERLGLLRIRAGARLRGYHRFAESLSPVEYVIRVIREELKDPTLSFQLKHGFNVLAVVPSYLRNDPESKGYAAVVEWLNTAVARPEDIVAREQHFLKQD